MSYRSRGPDFEVEVGATRYVVTVLRDLVAVVRSGRDGVREFSIPRKVFDAYAESRVDEAVDRLASKLKEML